MPIETTKEAVQDATKAIRACHSVAGPLAHALRSIALSESPIEAKFSIWFTVARDHLLAEGLDRFALQLRPQRPVSVAGANYRLDFALEPSDSWLRGALERAGLSLRIAVELDGHDYHERTKEQVTARNRRDRDLADAGWRVLHFSGSELHANPMLAVVEVLTVAADRLDQAKAALLHG